MDNGIIAEIRANKDAIPARYHCDLQALYAPIQQGEAALRVQSVALLPPPADPASLPPSACQRTRFARR